MRVPPRSVNVAKLVRAKTHEERSGVVSEDPVLGPALVETSEGATNPRTCRHADVVFAETHFDVVDLVREGNAGKEIGRPEGRGGNESEPSFVSWRQGAPTWHHKNLTTLEHVAIVRLFVDG